MSQSRQLKDREFWQETVRGTQRSFRCILCQKDFKEARHAINHEDSQSHNIQLKLRRRKDSERQSPWDLLGDTEMLERHIPSASFLDLGSAHHQPARTSNPPRVAQDPSNAEPNRILSDWHEALEVDDGAMFESTPTLSADDMAAAGLAAFMSGKLDDIFEPSDSDSGEVNERSGSEGERDPVSDTEQIEAAENFFEEGSACKQQRRTGYSYSKDWYPWEDRISCTTDILMHLPRSAFSENQMNLLNWYLAINGVKGVPSVKTSKSTNALLQDMCGIETKQYHGSLGHVYHVNDLAQIISLEFANPHIRPHLQFYPFEGKRIVEEACESEHWLNEVDDEFLTPMARIGGQDFFIHEPCMLHDGTARMVSRWLRRTDGTDMGSELYARVWRMVPVVHDGRAMWRVLAYDCETVHYSKFAASFPSFIQSHHGYGVPDPRLIEGIVYNSYGAVMRWGQTDPSVGNRWRATANGARVYAFPIWLYCDDTSGNASKKWNKHNSFLFTAAGLPRKEVQKEYNVHFLSTSNLAPPLEMLEGIVDQLDECKKTGIWAYDHIHGERVLVVPFVFALLGDNPMQSEMACHLGMRAKYFCRMCMAKGSDAEADDGSQPLRSGQSSSVEKVSVAYESDRVAGQS